MYILAPDNSTILRQENVSRKATAQVNRLSGQPTQKFLPTAHLGLRRYSVATMCPLCICCCCHIVTLLVLWYSTVLVIPEHTLYKFAPYYFRELHDSLLTGIAFPLISVCDQAQQDGQLSFRCIHVSSPAQYLRHGQKLLPPCTASSDADRIFFCTVSQIFPAWF